ncbi:MAG: 3-deoxy-8-phosphooctulonate synthase, partial [Alphaproteobacteria bacterium]
MTHKIIKIGNFEAANNRPFILIAGPCQMESREHAFDMCGRLKELTSSVKIPFIYKTSFDKANRTSLKAQRGIGMEKGLQIFADLKKEFGVPTLTD